MEQAEAQQKKQHRQLAPIVSIINIFMSQLSMYQARVISQCITFLFQFQNKVRSMILVLIERDARVLVIHAPVQQMKSFPILDSLVLSSIPIQIFLIAKPPIW